MSGSSIGTIAGGLIGGLLGFFVPVVGTAIGFSLGATLGGAIGGFIDSPKQPEIVGPRLTDLSVQTSTYGSFIPRCYGVIAVFGNIFWIQNNQITEVSKKVSQGGKGIGGGGATTKTYSYYGTFALGLCEGPIDGIRRIWIDNKLFYDSAATTFEEIVAAQEQAQYFSLYLGTDTQEADPIMQAALGAANVSAYRGLAYIVFYNLPLKDYGNSLQSAQIKVEIVNSATFSDLEIVADSIPYNSDWYADFVSIGNQQDSSGYSNYIVKSQTSPFKLYWLRKVGDAISQTELVSTALNILPVASVLTTMNYAYGATGLRYLYWGNGGTIYKYDSTVTNTYSAIAEKDEVIFSLTSTASVPTLAQLPFESGGPNVGDGIQVEKLSSITIGLSIFALLAIHDGLAVVCSRTAGANDPISVEVYSGTPLALVDSYTVALTGTYPINGQNSACVISGDNLYILSNLLIGSSTLLIVDLINKVLLATHILSPILPTSTTPLLANMGVVGNVVWWGQRKQLGAENTLFHTYAWALDIMAGDTIPLSEIVHDECLKSNFLGSSDIDVTELTDIVRGYRVSELAAIRGGIDPLRTAWPFDAIQSGYQIYFKRRGSASVATIDSSLLDARAAGSQDGIVISQSREMDSILPRKVLITYFDVVREYDINEQYVERINTDAVHESIIDLPIVLNADEAAQKAEVLMYLYWMERNDLLFKLPPTYSQLEPGDIITITGDNADYEARLTGIDYTADGRLECKAKYNKAVIYTAVAEGEEGQSTGVTLTLSGPSTYELLDIPLIQDVYDKPGFPIAMTGYLSGWPGGVIYRSTDEGQSWTDVQGFESPGSTIGYATNSLSTHGGTVLDKSSRLTVVLYQGSISSVTEQQMFQGQNWFAYGRDGSYEIIACQNADLQSDDSYILSDFLRGQMGTEWATGLHAANDKIIHLNSDELAFLTVDSGDIGVSYLYRGITLGKAIDSDIDRAFSYDAVNLECLSPCHATGSRHPTSNAWTITWVRRSRYAGWRNLVDTPLGEDSESYEIDIYSNSSFTTIKRTLTSTSETVQYTSAQQVTDFGSNQSTIYVKIYQLSALVGRGYALTATLTRS